MNFYYLTLLQAQGAAAQGGGSGLTMILMLALIFVVMWLFMIRPQQKRQKELNAFRDSLKKGDKVVTVGGIYGTVQEVNDNKVMLEIDKDVRIKVDKASLVKDFSDAQQA
ncbi:MAG: preprotein translocase subunit YajC [Bacteroidales bacterium]|jgi:preprotein translocase subunit YajC|nr:preprotein translocase subunit YajC [Bacteroidales bacterium]MBQ2599028.1 preprotein translocase subunit YajC [Bacteroidales bacterium]MBQ4013473.1 preprotein translocase subunit YajC [Bacteroidales bacterium]